LRVDMRLNLQSPNWAGPLDRAYSEGLKMARWADEQGLDAIRIGEHHGTVDNWCPSIMVLGSAVTALTERITVNLSAVLLPLHDPIMVAEDLAVLDIMARGRLEVVVAAGYNAAEFEMFGVDRAKRGALMEEYVGVLRQAWTGEEFEYLGRRVRVTPRPTTPGGPPLILGGSSGAAAKRAVRLGMEYFPLNAEAYEVFQEERLANGLPRAKEYSRGGPHLIHVTEDVDAAWEVLAPHFLLEAANYAAWSSTDTPTSGPTGTKPPTVDELRAGGKYVVVTPDQAIELVRSYHPNTIITVHPLVAGLDPEIGWASLNLFAETVLPVIRELDASRD
jgi:alkanesulfonate monooxygenase SsuD/methylene tetrahydromethanopterin reductase-like flavin-dependent oxidoreductase (luciferase family)